uniref:Beta-galactosidase n=1 Tax=Opalinidae sp. TaxID=2059444 RepID=A0A649UYY4_9STRA|nr:beta-galactosidase [Opalinidae sp.]
MGLNTISTYVAWNLHEPERGVYNFESFGNIALFLEICKKHNMYVLLRPGPYICGEWEFGGLPYWLLENQSIKIRTSDPAWTSEIAEWYSVFMPIIAPYLYSNGGTILLVQVENEYGSYPACDANYLHWLYNETYKYTGPDVVIYTTDGGGTGYLKCGAIAEAYAAVDFGPGDCTAPFIAQRVYQKTGPNMNAEYYPGWLSHWGEKFPKVATDPIVKTMKQMLDVGASVNFYVNHGGTNFGFYNGANGGGNSIQVDTTSYDYDAPVTEAGDTTPKYLAIREALKSYVKNIPDVPANTTKKAYGKITFTKSAQLFDNLQNQVRYTVDNSLPLYFEQVHAAYGYVLYTTDLKGVSQKTLNIGTIHDYAIIYLGNIFIGIYQRSQQGKDIQLGPIEGELKILVENQGRINYGGDMTDRKGISDVKINGATVSGWTMKTIPMESTLGVKWEDKLYEEGPAFYQGTFTILENSDIGDTWIDVRQWNKGHIVINGFNIGRYWEPGPPQHALYIPAPILKKGVNEIVVFEQSNPSSTGTMELIDHPLLEY